MGRLVNHLQQIHNFTDHCRDVLQNLMTQLNVLFGGKEKSPVKINPGIEDAMNPPRNEKNNKSSPNRLSLRTFNRFREYSDKWRLKWEVPIKVWDQSQPKKWGSGTDPRVQKIKWASFMKFELHTMVIMNQRVCLVWDPIHPSLSDSTVFLGYS